MRLIKSTVAAALLTAAVSHSMSAAVLTFEGLGNLESVDNFYNGGLGGAGSGPGANYGIAFTTTSLAVIDADAGGSGNVGNEPSPSTVLFFLDGNSATMNIAAGFTTGFSFFYSSVSANGFVNVYDQLGGAGGGGNIIATLGLVANGAGPGDPNGAFSNWTAVGVAFGGTAYSVDFGGVANQIAFDNITVGSQTPGGVPDGGSSAMLVGFGVLLMSRLHRRK